jgi:hypothetical protein
MLCSPRSQAFPNLFYAKMERDSRADASLALPLKIEIQIHFQRRFTGTESASALGRRVGYFNLNCNCEISQRASG